MDASTEPYFLTRNAKNTIANLITFGQRLRLVSDSYPKHFMKKLSNFGTFAKNISCLNLLNALNASPRMDTLPARR